MQGCLRRLILLAWLLLIGGGNEVAAQTPDQQENKTEQQLKIITNEVRLPLRAFDPLGRRVTDLSAKDLVVIEDGAACPVTSLKQEPANVMLVLDVSSPVGVIKSRLEDKETREKLFEGPAYTAIPRPIAREFVEILVRQFTPRNHVAIVQYADRVEMLQDWTRSPEDATQAVRAGFRVGIKARLYDALALAAKALNRAPPGRRVLILVTDGVDSASAAAKQSAFAQVLETGASLYVLSWTDILLKEARSLIQRDGMSLASLKRRGEIKRYSEQTSAAAAELKVLSEKSGGDYMQPEIISDMMLRMPQALVNEIDAEYTLTYVSQKDQVDRIAGIAEILIARPGISVYTRQAYKIKSGER